MARLPNLFQIGAQKGGSTFLATLLEKSPDITFFSKKEPNIFSQETVAQCEAKLNGYTVDDEGAKFLLDGSVDYTRFPYYPNTVRNIATMTYGTRPRFIYIMRNPVERTVSHYFYNRERWGEYLPFWEAIESDERYIWPSRYDVQIQNYLDHFPREDFLFVQMETLVREGEREYRRILDWIGARPPAEFDPAEGEKNATDKEMTRTARLPALNRVIRTSTGLRRLGRKLPFRSQMTINRLINKPVERERISAVDKQKLLERYFTETMPATEKLTGLDLGDWKAGFLR